MKTSILSLRSPPAAFSAALLALLGATAQAQTPLAFNTGVDDTGAVLSDFATDSHYQLITSADPRFPGPDTVVVDESLFPIATGDWLAGNTLSKWIAPQGEQDYLLDPTYGDAVGNYTYRTTFNLAGPDPELVQVSGQWSCDSIGIDILVNGAGTGSSIPTNTPYATRSWHPFLITAGFIAGTNTLDFVVQRVPWGNSTDLPTGLRAEFVIGNAPPPQLQIGSLGPLAIVWWPTNTPSFRLESSTQLGTPNWSAFAGPVMVVAGQNLIAVDASTGRRFFRLHRQ